MIQPQIYFTESEIITQLLNEGFRVSIRTLRYWRSLDKLPKLIYRSQYDYVYPWNIVEQIRDLCYSNSRLKPEVLKEYKLEDKTFLIYSIRIYKERNQFVCVLYTDQGILVERKEALNGICGVSK